MPPNGQGSAAGAAPPATYNFSTEHQTTTVPRPLQRVVGPPSALGMTSATEIRDERVLPSTRFELPE
jgi:hypothetical protein